jgi:hypothetical protein
MTAVTGPFDLDVEIEISRKITVLLQMGYGAADQIAKSGLHISVFIIMNSKGADYTCLPRLAPWLSDGQKRKKRIQRRALWKSNTQG